MDAILSTINRFVEDTTVLVAVAYLLARGRRLALLFRGRPRLWEASYLGAILGVVGLTEVAFPGARFPYTIHTLIVTFATLAGTLRVGLITAAVVTVGVFLLNTAQVGAGTMLAAFMTALTAEGVRRVQPHHHRLLGAFLAGVLSQSCALLIWFGLSGRLRVPELPSHALFTIPANGFGVMLLMLVVNEAQVRARSEQHRLEAERAQTLVAEAQLHALRACVHPHFLFNTLSSIAGLCGVAPDKAEAAIVRLGELMRRVLVADPATPQALGEEIEYVRSYLEIEQLRLGGRLRVVWSIDPAAGPLLVPPFAVQTLVENAIKHGIAPQPEPGTIVITVRRSQRRTVVAVTDDGVGMTPEATRSVRERASNRIHGLQILAQQLVLMYGPRARLRLFSRLDEGTMAVFMVPGSAGRSGVQAFGRSGVQAGSGVQAFGRSGVRAGSPERLNA
jgi:signal transduction histidine kinase